MHAHYVSINTHNYICTYLLYKPASLYIRFLKTFKIFADTTNQTHREGFCGEAPLMTETGDHTSVPASVVTQIPFLVIFKDLT